jgi:RNA polymerase sigma factor (sigma-70 family)
MSETDARRERETALLIAAQAGDRSAQNELWLQYRPLAVWLGTKLAQKRHFSPKDTAAAAVLLLGQAIAKWKPGEPSFRAYAAAFIRHRLKWGSRYEDREDRRTLTPVEKRSPEDAGHTVVLHDTRLTPEEALLEAERAEAAEAARERVNELLSRLPPLDQQIVRLHFGLDGLTLNQEEIGNLIGIAQPNVYARLHGAMAELRGEERRKSRRERPNAIKVLLHPHYREALLQLKGQKPMGVFVRQILFGTEAAA